MALSNRLIAGRCLQASAVLLIGLSASVSWSGLSVAVPSIAGFGLLGVVIGVALFGLGMLAGQEVADQRWSVVSICAVVLALTAGTDSYTNYLALSASVGDTEQANADRLARFETAQAQLATKQAEIVEVQALQALMVAEDQASVKQAQVYLSTLGAYEGEIDGLRGTQTLAAMRDQGPVLAERLTDLRADVDRLSAIQAEGVTVAKAPFTETEALWYGAGVTVFGIVLSFLGSYAVGSNASLAERERKVAEDEEAIDEMMTDIEEATAEEEQWLQSMRDGTYLRVV